MQEHRSKQATSQPTNTSKCMVNGEERRNPLTFQFRILKMYLMIVRILRGREVEKDREIREES
jgi:hypothetical protein